MEENHHPIAEEEGDSEEILQWLADVTGYRKFAPFCYYDKPWFRRSTNKSTLNIPLPI